MAKLPLRFRQIHLDFHTGPWIDDVGVDFDAREFAKTMKAAHVNSVTVFAKCHHGHLYYKTERPERHPGLSPKLDLLGEQIEALHREDIRAPIYISVQCDEYAADTHPEWIARQADGKPVGAGPLAPGWQILDMTSPYQQYLAEQTQEILRLFKPVDGIFFDMCWDQPSLNNYAVEAMVRGGFNPEQEDDRLKYSHKVARDYMKRFFDMTRATSKNATVYFNGRRYGDLAEEMPQQTQVEIEALPTGGWGYMYFPRHVRHARTFDRPYMGMTARFHKSWADFGGLKPYAALEYETSQMIAHGARCSVGDQMHPRGTLDRAAYDLIGKVYARVEAAEPFVEDTTAVSQIALIALPQKGSGRSSDGPENGAVRMLTQLKHQFDLVDHNADFNKYELLILPDEVRVDEALAARLKKYLSSGGAVMATGLSGLSADATEVVFPALGIEMHGTSPFKETFIRFGKEISEDVPPTDHVMYERGVRVTPAKGAAALARVVEPYFQRSWEHFSSHFQTPPSKLSKFAAVVQNGKLAYIPFPIFTAFAMHGNVPYKLLVRNVIERLMGEPILRVGAPSGTEATVMRQKNRTIVHLLHYSPERRTEKLDLIEDIVPLYNIPLSLKLESAPKRVYYAPSEKPIDFEYLAGRVNLRVPEVNGHAMIVFE